MKRLLLFVCLLPLVAIAQKYPTDYFRNPLNIPIFLAGNFGECRGGHFHSGLDIKTNGKENQPVYAAAEGYVSRIKMDKGGFGHAIYITHPGGYTTLYAHLNNFVPKIQKYLRAEQYKAEKWDIDLTVDATLFPLKKGEQIAFSGNTGSSSAPHLHFEIRDSKTEHPLNPQLFGFTIKDNRAPVPLEVAIYDLRRSIYEQSPQLIPLKKAKDAYQPADGTTITGNSNIIGIGIHVNDYMDGSDNTLNFYNAKMYMNDELVTNINLDEIGYDVTRYLHAYADYKTKEQKNKWIQCLFQLKGNKLDHLYNFPSGTGSIAIEPDSIAEIKIELTDNSGNTSTVAFTLQVGSVGEYGAQKCDAQFKANEKNSFEDPNVSFSLPETALYDDVCFTFASKSKTIGYSSAYQVHNAYVPIHNYFDMNIKPERTIPFGLRDKVVMKYSDGKTENARAATPTDKGWYTASVRNFGAYSLASDTEPPVITPAAKDGSNFSKANRMTFTIKDAITSIKKYKAEMNGQWILLEQHGNSFFYEFDEHCPKGKQTMVIVAADENNNSTTLRYTFTR